MIMCAVGFEDNARCNDDDSESLGSPDSYSPLMDLETGKGKGKLGKGENNLFEGKGLGKDSFEGKGKLGKGETNWFEGKGLGKDSFDGKGEGKDNLFKGKGKNHLFEGKGKGKVNFDGTGKGKDNLSAHAGVGEASLKTMSTCSSSTRRSENSSIGDRDRPSLRAMAT